MFFPAAVVIAFMLIGACNPMLCPIHVSRHAPWDAAQDDTVLALVTQYGDA